MVRLHHSAEQVIARSNWLYEHVAAIYAAWVRIGSLGGFPRLYREGCRALDLAGGEVVLDVCCGTGELFPYLQQAIGPRGRIIGCDLSAGMLARARRRCEVAGWNNVTLMQGDASTMQLPVRPDAAIFSICLSAIPWRERVLDHVLGQLPRGARVVVVDSLAVPGHPLANAYNRAKGRLIGADPDCRLRDGLAARLADFHERHETGGVYSLISGTLP